MCCGDTPPPNYPRSQHATHAFSQLPSIPQITAYSVVVGNIVLFYVSIDGKLNSWPLFGIFTGGTAAMVVFALVLSLSNPTDKFIYECKWREYKNEPLPAIPQNYVYCDRCASFCSIKSKHCRTCERCVEGFDHHCVWVNNCIGSSNYRWFFLMICGSIFHLGAFVVGASILTGKFDFDDGNIWGLAIFLWIFMLADVIFGILCTILFFLHVYLINKQMTTYQFMKERKVQQMNLENYSNTKKIKQPAFEISVAKINVKSHQNNDLSVGKEHFRKMTSLPIKIQISGPPEQSNSKQNSSYVSKLSKQKKSFQSS